MSYYREIAINYISDMDYFNNVNEFLLHHNIIDIDIKKLEFYIKIETNKMNREIKVKQLQELFNNNIAVEFNSNLRDDKIAIFHKCTKNNGNIYQISFIDRYGAEMDVAANTIDNIIEKFMSFYNRYNIINTVIPA